VGDGSDRAGPSGGEKGERAVRLCWLGRGAQHWASKLGQGAGWASRPKQRGRERSSLFYLEIFSKLISNRILNPFEF